jgi:hypothetical protein
MVQVTFMKIGKLEFSETCSDLLKGLPEDGTNDKLTQLLTRVNSTNVLDEELRIREIGHRMNSKVKLVEIGVCRK